MPDFWLCFEDFEAVFQQLAVAAPESIASDREKSPFNLGSDHDAGEAGLIICLSRSNGSKMP